MEQPRTCPICGTSLEGRRKHARFCSAPCRAEGSRLRRLLSGREVDGYGSVARDLRENAHDRPRERYHGSIRKAPRRRWDGPGHGPQEDSPVSNSEITAAVREAF